LKDAFTDDSIGGGFLNRHLIAYCEPSEDGKCDRRDLTEPEWRSLADLFEPLVPRRTFMMEGSIPVFNSSSTVITLDPSAGDMFIQYQKEAHHKMKLMDDLESDICAREESHALKLAAHHAILRGRTSIDSDALYFGYTWAKASSEVLMELVKSKNHNKDEASLLRLLKDLYFKNKKLPVKKSQVSKAIGGKQDKVNRTLQSLTTNGLIEEVFGGYLPVLP
jgi:hypothetical protein